jgi:hypothetical protein
MRIEGHVVASALVIKLPMAGKVSRQHWEARNASKTCRGGIRAIPIGPIHVQQEMREMGVRSEASAWENAEQEISARRGKSAGNSSV